MHRATPARTPLPTVLSHVVLPVLMGVIMAFAYLGGFHKPEPHALPVAVVGQAETAGPVAAKIQQALGDRVAMTTVASADQARDELRHQKLLGAYVPSAKNPQLLTAPASSESATGVVTTMFTAVAAKQGAPLAVEQVVPLTEADPAGQNGFFYMVPVTVASYAAAIAIGAAGATRRFRERMGIMLGTAVVIGTVMLGVAMMVFDMFSGHGAAAWGLSVLYSLAILAIGVGLHPIVGRYCTLLFSAVFVAFNFTSSGGVFPAEMQPGLYGWMHEFWIGSGLVDALKHVVYFPQTSLAHPLWILIGWLAVGGLCLALGAMHEQRVAALGRQLSTLADLGRRHPRGSLSDEETRELELEEDVAV